jgi:hypothetical protein
MKISKQCQRLRLKLAPGQPSQDSKLNDELEKKICGLIAGGASYDPTCRQCDISRTTFYNWRLWGTVDPKSRYGRFFAAIKKALSAKKRAAVAEAKRRIYARKLRRFL